MISSCHCEYTHKKPPIKYFCQNTQPESDEVFGISDYRKYMKRRMFLNKGASISAVIGGRTDFYGIHNSYNDVRLLRPILYADRGVSFVLR